MLELDPLRILTFLYFIMFVFIFCVVFYSEAITDRHYITGTISALFVAFIAPVVLTVVLLILLFDGYESLYKRGL